MTAEERVRELRERCGWDDEAWDTGAADQLQAEILAIVREAVAAAEAERDNLKVKVGHLQITVGFARKAFCDPESLDRDPAARRLKELADGLLTADAPPDATGYEVATWWRDKFNKLIAKIGQCHDLLDAAGAVTAEGTHQQLLGRLKMLVDERDRLAAENAALRAALKPFADWYALLGTVGTHTTMHTAYRRAAALLVPPATADAVPADGHAPEKE